MILKGNFVFVSKSIRHFDASGDRPARDVSVVNVIDEDGGRVQSFFINEEVPEFVMGDDVELTFNVYVGRDNAYHVTLRNIDSRAV